MATPELPPATPARCSVLGLYQAAQVSVTATTTTAPSTASSTSTMPQNVFLTGKIVTIKHPFMVHSKCLMSVPSQAAHVVMSAATSSTPPTPSSTSAPPQGIILADPIAFTKHAAAAPTGCPMPGCCSAIVVPAPMVSSTAATTFLHNIAGHHVSEFSTGMSIDASLPYHVVGICGSQMLFEVYLSECLELYPSRLPLMLAQLTSHNMMQLKIPWPPPKPPEIIVATAELRPTPWPSFKFSQQGMFVQFKIPWPPHVQIVVGKVVGLQPMLWPSLFSCLTRVQWRQEPLMLEFAVSEFSTWLRTNVTVLFLFVRPIFCILWRKCLEETETQVQDQLMHLLLALVSSWMVWCSHLKVDGCSRREAIKFFQPYVHVLLLDNETCKWSLVWIVVALLPGNSYGQEIDESRYQESCQEILSHFLCGLVCPFYLVKYLWRKKHMGFSELCPSQEKCTLNYRLCITSALVAVKLFTCPDHRQLLNKLLPGLSWDFERLPPPVQRFYLGIHMEQCWSCLNKLSAKSSVKLLSVDLECWHWVNSKGAVCKQEIHSESGSTQQDEAADISSQPPASRICWRLIIYNDNDLVQSYGELLDSVGKNVQRSVQMLCIVQELMSESYITSYGPIGEKSTVAGLPLLKLLVIHLIDGDCWNNWLFTRCLKIDRETTCLQQILKQDGEARVQKIDLGQYWCYLKLIDDARRDGMLTFDIMNLQVPWDPGGSKFVGNFTTAAWGQAVFQGGKYVRNLLELQAKLGWIKAWAAARPGLAGWPKKQARVGVQRDNNGVLTSSSNNQKDNRATGGGEHLLEASSG